MSASSTDRRAALLDLLASAVAGRPTKILSMAGPGCAGKSTFALRLAAELKRRGTHATTLDLDCFLKERAERARAVPPLSGYNPRSYCLDEAREAVDALLRGEAIQARPYDKASGRRSAPVTLQPAPVLIIEGSMALTEPFLDLGSLGVFLDADRESQFVNRLRREQGYGFAVCDITAKFEQLWVDYERYIRPQRQSAQIRTMVDRHYRFTELDVVPSC